MKRRGNKGADQKHGGIREKMGMNDKANQDGSGEIHDLSVTEIFRQLIWTPLCFEIVS